MRAPTRWYGPAGIWAPSFGTDTRDDWGDKWFARCFHLTDHCHGKHHQSPLFCRKVNISLSLPVCTWHAPVPSTFALNRLGGKVALITGGASGIGACTARLFSQHGAKVVIADIQDRPGMSLCMELGGPDFATFIHCDVTRENDVRNAVDAAVAAFGKLDIMYNNAGVLDVSRPLVDSDVAEFERVVGVNLKGAFLGAKHAARVMIPARRGSIIFTASITSVVGGNSTYGYTSSKHAVLGLMKNAAVELGQYGIRVNCVSPYGVATRLGAAILDMEDDEYERWMSEAANLKGRVLKAEDIALAALYLASDESQYVSGHNLVVDGGYTIVNPSISAAFNRSSSAS